MLEFRFSDHNQWFWVLNDDDGPSICLHDPGFGVDASIRSDLSTMYQVWLGKLPLRTALRDGTVTVTGAPAIVRRVPSMLELSPMAERVAAARG